MRILVNDVAILERARLRFIGVADEVDRLGTAWLDEAPFGAARKAGAATSPQTRGFNLVNDLLGRHSECGAQIFVATILFVASDVGGPHFPIAVFADDPRFARMRGP